MQRLESGLPPRAGVSNAPNQERTSKRFEKPTTEAHADTSHTRIILPERDGPPSRPLLARAPPSAAVHPAPSAHAPLYRHPLTPPPPAEDGPPGNRAPECEHGGNNCFRSAEAALACARTASSLIPVGRGSAYGGTPSRCGATVRECGKQHSQPSSTPRMGVPFHRGGGSATPQIRKSSPLADLTRARCFQAMRVFVSIRSYTEWRATGRERAGKGEGLHLASQTT